MKLILLLLPATLLAQAPAADITAGQMNCRGWVDLLPTPQSKGIFVWGLNEGVAAALIEVKKEETIRVAPLFVLARGGSTHAEVAAGIDKVCAQPENALLPVAAFLTK